MGIEFLPLDEAIDNFNILVAVGLFVFYLFVEMLDSSLVFSLVQHKSGRSAAMTFVLYITIAIEIAAIVTNYLYILPVALGAALGSYIVVENEKKKRPIDKEKS